MSISGQTAPSVGPPRPVSAPLLSMRGITKAFGDNLVLDAADFDLAAGEVHVLAGENGAGKSTLMKILAGVHAQYEGRVAIDGRPVHFRTPQEARAGGISVIHQEMSLVAPMSVADNVFLGHETTGLGGFRRDRRQRAETAALLSRFGLDLDAGRAVEDFPLSVQQMIEIAKALAFSARIIVMDEPTSALTEPEVERLFAIIAGLRKQGCGIVYISHKMQEIYRVADRITVLRDGRTIGTAPAAGLSQQELVKWMVGREITQQFPERDCRPGHERLRVEGFSLPDPAGVRPFAVRDISFAARAGEIVGFAGLQGSGNSELLNGLFGAYGRPAGGRVFVDGAKFAVRSPRESVRRGLALLTNDRKTGGLVLGMSITHNVTLAALRRFSPGGWLLPGRERRAAASRCGELRIRAASPDLEAGWLSGGNQQKVVLGKWLETHPRVLLLDEPTRGVDVGAKHEIYELMNQWSSAGCTILLITSEMPELLALSDRIIVMHRREATGVYARGEATQEGILKAAMGERQTPAEVAQ